MSARRRRMSGTERAGEVPDVLTATGVSAALWESPAMVAEWCARRGLPAPDPVFDGSPRALRDDVAVAWSAKHYPHPRFPGRPDWGAAGRAGVAPISGARVRARREALTR